MAVCSRGCSRLGEVTLHLEHDLSEALHWFAKLMADDGCDQEQGKLGVHYILCQQARFVRRLHHVMLMAIVHGLYDLPSRMLTNTVNVCAPQPVSGRCNDIDCWCLGPDSVQTHQQDGSVH